MSVTIFIRSLDWLDLFELSCSYDQHSKHNQKKKKKKNLIFILLVNYSCSLFMKFDQPCGSFSSLPKHVMSSLQIGYKEQIQQKEELHCASCISSYVLQVILSLHAPFRVNGMSEWIIYFNLPK